MIVKKRTPDNDIILFMCLPFGISWLLFNVLFQYQYIIYKMNPEDYDLKQGVIKEIEETHLQGWKRSYTAYETIVSVDGDGYKIVHKYGDKVGDTVDVVISKYNSQYHTRNEYLILSFCSSSIDTFFLICFIVLFTLWFGLCFADRQKRKKYEADADILKIKLLDKYGNSNSLLHDNFDEYNAECVRKLNVVIPPQIEWCLKNLDCSILAEKIPCLHVLDGIPDFILNTLDYRNEGLSEQWIVCCVKETVIYCIEINDEKIYSISKDGFSSNGQVFVEEYEGFLDYVAESLDIKR